MCELCILCALSVSSADILDNVRETGTFTIGYRTDAPPFSYEAAAGGPKGLAFSLCLDVSEMLKRDLELDEINVAFVPVTARSRFGKLESGVIDILCGPTTQTISRREKMDFSVP